MGWVFLKMKVGDKLLVLNMQKGSLTMHICSILPVRDLYSFLPSHQIWPLSKAQYAQGHAIFSLLTFAKLLYSVSQETEINPLGKKRNIWGQNMLSFLQKACCITVWQILQKEMVVFSSTLLLLQPEFEKFIIPHISKCVLFGLEIYQGNSCKWKSFHWEKKKIIEFLCFQSELRVFFCWVFWDFFVFVLFFFHSTPNYNKNKLS